MRAAKVIATVALGLASLQAAWAGPIHVAPTVGPSDVAVTCTTNNQGGSDINNFLVPDCGAPATIDLLYKQNTPGIEEGSLAGSYTTTTNGDLSGGTITWVTGSPSVDCLNSSCWLVVKDGNQVPARYGFNLQGIWDGISTITLSGFWPGNGSISHIALFGELTDVCTLPNGCGPDRIPEPATLALVGLALVGLGVSRRRRQS